MQIRDIVFIGSGNLATHLAIALYKAGKNIVCVYSRTNENAKILAEQCDACYINHIEEIPKSADLYIIATNDSSIKELAEKLSGLEGIVVHTSGSMPVSVFSDHFVNFGVLYPLMTFSKKNVVSFNDIPVCLEANSAKTFTALDELAHSISDNVSEVSSEKRKILHLAAVFACNFSNLNYIIAEDLLNQNQLSFDLLKPLIKETAQKILTVSPSELQTGPAVREDYEVMHAQMEMLNEMPGYKEIYQRLSKLILSIKYQNE